MLWIAIVCYIAVAVVVFGFVCSCSERGYPLWVCAVTAAVWPISILVGVGARLGDNHRQMNEATPDVEKE